MVKIDIHNYEAYLLDFAEGNLTSDQQFELEIFLMQHPELNIDLTTLSEFPLISEDVYFENKQSLKKNINDLISENTFIAYIENQLSETDKFNVEKNCSENAELAKELRLYQHTKVVTDPNILFGNKDKLKRKVKIIWFNFSPKHFAAAASVLILFGLFILWTKKQINTSNNNLTAFASVNSRFTKAHVKNSIVKSIVQKNHVIKKQNSNNISSYKKHVNIILDTTHHSITQSNLKVTNDIDASKRIDAIGSNDTANQIVNKDNNNIIEQKIDITENTKQKYSIQVLTEVDDEIVNTPIQKKKKGLWALAGKAFKKLNDLGVKTIDGTETLTADNTSYTLNLGNLSVNHKGNN